MTDKLKGVGMAKRTEATRKSQHGSMGAAYARSVSSVSLTWTKSFLRRHWPGTVLLLAATLIFFLPIVIRLNSYSPGGDAMFNAWEMSRNQHCILRQGCPNYFDANIYYPNKDTMLYTEEQLSPAVVTLPFHWLTDSPILAYNAVTIALFFLSGWCMYLLVKYLSGGREVVAILAGLAFEFAPFKMASIWHLQNLSIFCLPLGVLLVLKFVATHRKRYLWLLALPLLYVTFASWVQMVFVYLALGLLLAVLLLFRQTDVRRVLLVGAVMAVVALTAAPLALQYVKFAKVNHAAFGIRDQELYNSSLIDYVTPYDGTLVGKLYYHLRPGVLHNAYNLDSYSYHGMVLYAAGLFVLICSILWRKRSAEHRRRYVITLMLAVLGVVGFTISLGPLLKIKGSYTYPGLGGGVPVSILMPWGIVDKLLPQLSFIRAVGRASVLLLFALCAALAFVPFYLTELGVPIARQRIILMLVAALIIVELMPVRLIQMSQVPQSYGLTVPAVYRYIAAHKTIDGIAILRGNDDYPGAPIPIARAEDVLWSGYHNRNIFNGYSGYTPPVFWQEYIDFINFTPAVIPEMHQLHIRYVLIDKLLSGSASNKPQLLHDISQSFPLVYQDSRYSLFKVSG